jgi:hypothetical protein
MPDETITGANVASEQADVLTPPVSDGFEKVDPSVESVSDIDGPAKEEETKAADTVKVDAKATAEKTEKAEKDDLDRLDKHPRFQELIKERDAFKQELAKIQGKLEVLTPARAAEPAKPEVLPYIDITTKTKEELLEWNEDDPKGYAANLYQQMRYELKAEMEREARQQHQTTSVKTTFDTYAKNNPDFVEKWNSGEIRNFMTQNPGHNAISAHKELTEKTRMDTAVAKAVKDAEERVQKNFQAKRNAEVIRDGGAVRTEGVPDELKNPEKYGGPVSVGAMRLERMRRQAAGG